MQGLKASSLLVTFLFVVLLSVAAAAAHKRRLVTSESEDEPCMKMSVYYHDILYDAVYNSDAANATSAAATSPSPLSPTGFFGMMVVFNDPVTKGKALPAVGGDEEVARAHGLYFYNRKDKFSAWFAMSLVFNSTAPGARRGTLELMGADLMDQKTRDISVVGGTGDFFMARGVATLRTDAVEGVIYYRLQMDIKLYQCYL